MSRLAFSGAGGMLALLFFVAPVAGQEPAPVVVAKAELAESRSRLELTGSFVARRSARLSPRVSGLVAQTPADTGDPVEAGDVVLRLDATLAQLALAQAEAVRNEALARFSEAERLRDEARRLAQDRFVAATETAAREAGVQVAAAGLATAEAALATAREAVARHDVIAPFSGVISQRLTEAGEWVQTGTPVLGLVDPDALWLDVRAPQEYFSKLSGRVAAQVHVDALENQSLPAQIHARVPVSDPGARTFLLRMVVTDPSPGLVPGMSARVAMSWTDGARVVRLPRDAIVRFPDGTTTVWVVQSAEGQSTAHETPVTVSRFDDDRVEISAGLSPGQSVVIRGNEVLSEGQRVRMIEPS